MSPLGFDDDELAEHLEGGRIKSQPGPPKYRAEDTAAMLRERRATGTTGGASGP